MASEVDKDVDLSKPHTHEEEQEDVEQNRVGMRPAYRQDMKTPDKEGGSSRNSVGAALVLLGVLSVFREFFTVQV